jgi:23S rRNA U2552 (ribose-2'-O)-methylase RlmE/FtsJ
MSAAAEAAVLNLITTHNRPFGVQGLVDNLQSAGIKKAAVQKAVDALTDKGQIVCKVCCGASRN